MAGMQRQQALDMAKKLGFKDKLADEVSHLIFYCQKKILCYL